MALRIGPAPMPDAVFSGGRLYDAHQVASSKNHNIWWYLRSDHHKMLWAHCCHCVTRVDELWGSGPPLWTACGGRLGPIAGHANTNEELVAAARARIASLQGS